MHTATRSAVLLAALTLLFSAAPARAETVACTAITTVPYVITLPGIYCLTGDLSTAMTSGYAIEIQTSNVVLDLNGHKLGGLAAGPGTVATGIFASARKNITIRNGTVRGFVYGILLGNSPAQGHVVEDVRADQNTIGGIRVEGTGIIIRNNQVVATGGATCCGANASTTGIWALGTGARVLDNDVVDTAGVGTGAGRAISMTTTGGMAVNNRITQADLGIIFSGSGPSTGKYRDNITFAVTAPYTGGTDIGNNN